MSGESKPRVPVRPASTVVLLRDTANGMETLMLKRNKALLFAGGAWVFPGGALEPADYVAAEGDENALDQAAFDAVFAQRDLPENTCGFLQRLDAPARQAAAREALEESGVEPDPEQMVLLSHWTTPVVEPKRFATWIYAAPVARDTQVSIDGSEIHAARWLGVADAVSAHEAGEMGMLPPTYITLQRLSGYTCVAELVAAERSSPVPEIFPLFARNASEPTVLFRGDAGYAEADALCPGARHRATLRDEVWRYEYRDVTDPIGPLVGSD